MIAEADSRNIFDPFQVNRNGTPTTVHQSSGEVRLGYPALRGIFDTAAANGRPLDLLTVINVVNNDVRSNVERWQSMIDDGFDVRDMELGNEFFFRTQRSGTINTVSAWLGRARRIVEGIRARAREEGRDVRFALPITYRASDSTEPLDRQRGDQQFNDQITAGDDSFYDAVVVHRYVREQRDRDVAPEALTTLSLRRLLSASRIMDNSLEYAKGQVSEDRNGIWLTEWGVAGSGEEGVGAAFLGAADTYTHLIRNEDRLEMERINWFSTLGSNAQYEFTAEINNNRDREVQNIIRRTTGYGRIYEMFRGVLRDSDIYKGIIVTTDDLTNDGENVDSIGRTVKAVNAVAVRESDRSITYIVTNLANRSTRITLRRNGTRQNGFDVRLSGIGMETLRSTEVDLLSARTLTNQNGITIPGYSVMRVEVTFDGNVAKSIDDTKTVLEDHEASVTLYPNPTADSFEIALKGMENANIVISDLLGKVVYKTTTEAKRVQLEKGNTFKTGLYLVKITDQDNNTYNSKLVIN